MHIQLQIAGSESKTAKLNVQNLAEQQEKIGDNYPN